MNNEDFNPQLTYQKYLEERLGDKHISLRSTFWKDFFSQCNWENPQTGWDLNNRAVAALIEAEKSDHSLTRGLYLEMAIADLELGVNQSDYPLCAAHLALLYTLLGEYQAAAELAFNQFINCLQPLYTDQQLISGLIYLPFINSSEQSQSSQRGLLDKILSLPNAYNQAVFLLLDVLCRTQLIIDNPQSLRLLNLLNHLSTDLTYLNYKLGVYMMGCEQFEGLLYLHRSQEFSPDQPLILQSLSLAYEELDQLSKAEYWRNVAQEYRVQKLDNCQWEWCILPLNHPFTYVEYEFKTLLTINSSYRSITTRSLLAEGDWFEKEIEFWRSTIQPGMTVIDIGANVGVYTVSAGVRVGEKGRVIAIEPHIDHVNCLRETCKANDLNWVEIIPSAISNYQGISPFFNSPIPEYHRLITKEETVDIPEEEWTEVSCQTLDGIIEELGVNSIDIIKISAVGQELTILQSGEVVINKLKPIIIYDHLLPNGKVNMEAGKYLCDRNYQLYRYQPYIKELITLDSLEDSTMVLKVIALPGNN
jgi:FkbM family methyltransferase